MTLYVFSKIIYTNLIIYILLATKFLGLYDVNNLSPISLFNILNLIFFILSLILLFKKQSNFFWISYIFISFIFLYCLLVPILFFNQELINSLKEGNDILLFFLIFLVPYIKKNDLKKIQSFFIFSSFVIGLHYFLICFLNINLSVFAVEPDKIGITIWNFNYTTFFILSYLVVLKNYINEKNIFLFFIAIFFLIAIYLTKFESQFLTIILISLLLIFFYFKKNIFQPTYLFFFLISFIIGLIFILIYYEKILIFIFNIINFNHPSLFARIETNDIRYYFMKDNLWTGYGFLDSSSNIGKFMLNVGNNNYNNTLRSVDTGFLNYVITFGLPLSILITIYSILSYFHLKKNYLDYDWIYFKLIIIFILINSLIHSYLTYNFGILFLILSYSFLLNNEKK